MKIKNLIVVYSARTYWQVIPMLPVSYPEFFLGIPVHLYFEYLSGTDGHPIWLRAMLERFLTFRVSRLA